MNFVVYSKRLWFNTALQNGDCAILFVAMSSCSPFLDSLCHIQIFVFFTFLTHTPIIKKLYFNFCFCYLTIYLAHPCFFFFFLPGVSQTHGEAQINSQGEVQPTNRPSLRVFKWALKHRLISVLGDQDNCDLVSRSR